MSIIVQYYVNYNHLFIFPNMAWFIERTEFTKQVKDIIIHHNMNVLDSVDKQIVMLMGQNARQSSDKIAERLGLNPATVRRRIGRLLKNDLVRIVAIADPANFGFTLGVVINLDVENSKLESVINWLVDRSEVKWAALTTGRFDITAVGRFESTDHLSSFLTKDLAKMEGIKDTETLISLDVKKGRYITLT
jgi:Lrp/AsnC family transcriptional regulator for asnA, asnC and gidA